MTRRDGRTVRPPTVPTGRRRTAGAAGKASTAGAAGKASTAGAAGRASTAGKAARASRMVDGVPEKVARGRGHLIVPVLLSVITLAAVLLFLVAPAQTWLEQRRQLNDAERDLAEVLEVNAGYEQRIADLQTDAEVARIAREQYNLVGPGQEAYVVLPAPTTTTTLVPASSPTVLPASSPTVLPASSPTAGPATMATTP